MTPHRTLAGPALPTRPALTRWQRVLVRALGDRCRAWRWYRAHVGGRWCRAMACWEQHARCPADVHAEAAREHARAVHRLVEMGSPRLAAVVVFGAPAPTPLAQVHAAHCTCEVYPYPALGGRDEVV